jgi:HK97 family phage major capsid protein
MKTILELKRARFEAQKKYNAIGDKVQAENRSLTAEELNEVEALETEIRSLDVAIKVASDQTENRGMAERMAKFDTIHEMCEEIRAVMRKEKDEAHINLRAAITAMNSTTTAAAQASFVEGVIAPLQNTIHKLVGTKIRTGMKYGAKWVVPGIISATINDEAVELTASQIPMSALSTSPKDVGVQVNATNQALEFSDIDLISEVILPAIQSALETIVNKWMFSTTAIATGCAGAFVNVDSKNKVSFAGAVPTYKELQQLIGKVRARGVQNDGTFAFVMSSGMAAELRGTSRDTGSGRMIIEDDKINGIPVFETEDIENGNTGAAKYIGFGRFSDHLIGQFGDVTMKFDNSSAKVAAANLAYWTVHMFLDQKVLRQEAFALGTAKVS